ncbi:MAG: GNAT family N-acetyltransferase [Deltaproteobacteria bacterium]|nr:GNAT family N-acetyltransferase [Deltaproteobacteria bacterium]
MPQLDRLETTRLVLRKPRSEDAQSIFSRYASDPNVTRFVAWPRHCSVDDSKAFLEFSETEWKRWSIGPYLIESKEDGRLIGSAGLSFETSYRVSTGYVLAQDSWGAGYATEVLEKMVCIARELAVRRIYALCHPDHRASQRVLEKGGFEREAILRCYTEFPNLRSGEPNDVLCYTRLLP